MDLHGILLLREGHGHLVDELVGAQNHLAGKLIKAPVKELDGLGKALDLLVAVFQGNRFGTQYHAEEGAPAAGGSGNEAVTCVAGGAGLDALRALVDIASGPHGGEKVVGGVVGPGVGEIGGGDLNDLGVADGHEHLVLHGLLGDEVEVPGGGIVVGVLKAVGVGKVGVLTADGVGPGVHVIHEGLDGAGDSLGQNVAGLVGGYHQDAVEELFHRQLLSYLDTGIAAVGGQVVDSGLGGGEDCVHGQFSAVHGLQHQKGGHDLGEAGRVEPLMDIPGIKDFTGIRICQQCGLGGYLPVTGIPFGGQGGGPQSEDQNDAEKKREKTAIFHIILPINMVYSFMIGACI